MHRYIWLVCVVLVIQLCVAISSVEPDQETLSPGTLASRQYEKAIKLRAKAGVSAKQLKHAASLLKAAAGVNVAATGAPLAENALLANRSSVEIHPGLQVANETHIQALKLLSELYLHDDQGLPFHSRVSLELLKHAAQLGDPEARREFGLRLAAGIIAPTDRALLFQLGPRKWKMALLHLFLSAAGNDSLAQMALGYRYSHGFGVAKSCAAAVLYYQAAAEKVVAMARYPYDLPRVERVLLSSHGSKGSPPSREQELLHYQWFADMGYVDAQRAVGRLLAQGGPETADRALHYFRQAAAADDADAMAHLGHMHANGIVVTASNETAIKWFRAGSERGNANAHFGLGFMYLKGQGLPQDYRLAVRYLTAAAEQGHPEAWFHLGSMHANGWGVAASNPQAQAYFSLAAKAGHVLAKYNLAMMFLRKGRHERLGYGQCEAALEQLKSVAERGPWSMMLQEASEAFMEGRHDRALVGYLKASEVGYELAQANAAWMLGKDYGLASGQSARGFVEPGSAPSFPALVALRAHQRASQQGNVESILALGDAFYYGRGVARDWPKAFQLYTAATRFRNAQALFNVGFMHEYGAGVLEDLELAKRSYDKALQYLPGAGAPVYAALLSLRLHGWWKAVQPYLPLSLQWLWGGIYTLSEPSRATQPLGSYLPKPSFGGGLERLVESAIISARVASAPLRAFAKPLQIWGAQASLDAELLETGMLIVLIGCLWLVVWRRMSLRSARHRQNADAAPPPPPPPVGPGTVPTDAAPLHEGHTASPTASESSSGSDSPSEGAGGAGDESSRGPSSSPLEVGARSAARKSVERRSKCVLSAWEERLIVKRGEQLYCCRAQAHYSRRSQESPVCICT